MPRPGARSPEGRFPAGLSAVLVRLVDALAVLALGAAVGLLTLGGFTLGTLTVGTLTRGSADRRLRDRTGRGMSALIKADPGARLVRRRATSFFRSVGVSMVKQVYQQRIRAVVVPRCYRCAAHGLPGRLPTDVADGIAARPMLGASERL